MQPRINALSISAEPVKAMHALGKYLSECSLETSLQELVKIISFSAVPGTYQPPRASMAKSAPGAKV